MTGKYQSKLGATSCLNCPSGHYLSATGGKNISDCGSCLAGTYSETGSSISQFVELERIRLPWLLLHVPTVQPEPTTRRRAHPIVKTVMLGPFNQTMRQVFARLVRLDTFAPQAVFQVPCHALVGNILTQAARAHVLHVSLENIRMIPSQHYALIVKLENIRQILRQRSNKVWDHSISQSFSSFISFRPVIRVISEN